MKAALSRRHISVLLLFFFAISSLAAGDDQATWRERFAKSREQSEIRTKDSPGFVLRGSFRLWLKKDAPVDGKYLYVWTQEGKWKEEIALPEYNRSRVGDGTRFWQVRSSNDESPVIFELEQLIANSRVPLIREGDKLVKDQRRTVAGMEVGCTKREGQSATGWFYCFDLKTNDLVEVNNGHESSEIPWQIVRQQSSDFQEWSGKRVPHLLRGYNGKAQMMEVRFDELKPVPQLPSDFFAPGQGATVWADCNEASGKWRLKEKVPPEYPRQARMERKQGTVQLMVVIREDGHVSKVKVVHTPYPSLGESAASAVSMWRYERTSACATSKGPTETMIEMIYSLQE